MKSKITFITLSLISLSYVQSFKSKIFPNTLFLKDLRDGIQFANKEADNSKEYWFKESEEIGLVLHDYMISRLKQNTFKALQKLTHNWQLVPYTQRAGRQAETPVALRNIIARSESTFNTLGKGFGMADTVIQSLIGILRIAQGRPWPIASEAKPKARNSNALNDLTNSVESKESLSTSGVTAKKGTKTLHSDYLPKSVDSLRDKSYSDQLIGALNILAVDEGSSRLKRETIKSTVDYIVDVFISTNGKTQALFLPPLFEGIPKGRTYI